jgi:hypothetical protein
MPRTRLTEKYGKPTKTEEPIKVEVDEATRAQREADTLAWLEDPSNQAALEEGRRALELELAEADRKRRRQADTESDTETDTALGEEIGEETGIESGFETVSVTEVEAPPVWSASAKLTIPPRDPDDPFDAWQVLDVTVELYDRPAGYVLAVVMPDGTRDELPPVETRDGWVAGAAYRGIKITDDADWQAFNALPLEHPVKERRRLAQLKWIDRVSSAAAKQAGERGPRQVYRDCDLLGQRSTYSDGVHTWD